MLRADGWWLVFGVWCLVFGVDGWCLVLSVWPAYVEREREGADGIERGAILTF